MKPSRSKPESAPGDELADRGICTDCARELEDPNSRLYRYPFIHCNRCGPRAAILERLPLQRENSSLKAYPACAACMQEQRDPQSRRFRLETIICPQCGPQIRLEIPTKSGWKISAHGEEALNKAQNLLAEGKLLLVQGLGTQSIRCDAANPQAGAALRRRLRQAGRPLTVLFPNPQAIGAFCRLDEAATFELESAQRPALFLEICRRPALGKQAFPDVDILVARLPFDGLERLLFLEGKKGHFSLGGQPAAPTALLTASIGALQTSESANASEIAANLGDLLGGCLLHDFPFQAIQEDTLVRHNRPAAPEDGSAAPVAPESALWQLLHLGRGYAPCQIRLRAELPAVLAGGSQRDNTICLVQGYDAHISPQIGELSHAFGVATYESQLRQLLHLSGIQPQLIAHDLDSNQVAARCMLEKARLEGLPAVAVQHHQAHLAACLAEVTQHNDTPIIGVAFDFGGAGMDEQKGQRITWGGEFFLVAQGTYQRMYHLAYQPLPGGMRSSARTALAYLWEAGLEWKLDIPSVAAICAQETSLLRSMLKHRLSTPPHSSMGILFDAVASLIGLRQETSYTAQALWELEAAADPDEAGAYSFDVREGMEGPGQIDPLPVIRTLVTDLQARVKTGPMAARFLNGVAELVCEVSSLLRQQQGVNEVALSGEVWQNQVLLQRTSRLLHRAGFQVHTHHWTPPNNACVSLGQAIIAGTQLSGASNPGRFQKAKCPRERSAPPAAPQDKP